MASGRKVVLEYELQHKLGSGSFAKVYKGVHITDGSVVAVKVVARDKLTEKLQQNLAHEIHILKHMRHPNIVALYSFQKRSSTICLILEYCDGGDLHRFIRDHPARRLSETVARHFLRHLAAGLKFLWAQNLIHRDIKPQNLLLTVKHETATLKIADFGFARYIGPQAMAATLCGTPLYMAPEVLENKEYDTKADLWSVGCVYFEMFVGRPPFTGANHIELLKNIRTKRLLVPDDVIVSPDSVSVLRLLLNRQPATRGNLAQFLGHVLFAGSNDDPTLEGHVADASQSFQHDLGANLGPPVASLPGPPAVPSQSVAKHRLPAPVLSVPGEAKAQPTPPRAELKASPAPASPTPNYDPLPHVDISSQQSVHPPSRPPKVVSPCNSQQASSNSDDFVVIEAPAYGGDASDATGRPKRASGSTPHPSTSLQAVGSSASTNSNANSAEANVARIANGLPFVEVYAQFAFAVAGVGDSRVLRFLGDFRDSSRSWFEDGAGAAASSARPGSTPREVLLHEALTLYKKALSMLKHCVGLVRKHLSHLGQPAPRSAAHSRAAVSEQQRAQGLLPWLLESMQNILERADECNIRLKASGLVSERSRASADRASQVDGKQPEPLEGQSMTQSGRVGRSPEEMMYEFASQLVQDGSAKEMLGQIQNAHGQLVRAQILLDALQLEGHAGMSLSDAEQLRAYSHRLRQKVQGLESRNPALPQSGSLIRRLVA